MVKDENALYDQIKRSPDNQFYLNLISLIDMKLANVKDKMIDSKGDDTLIYQGRARELRDLKNGLALKARVLDDQFTGAHGY